MNSLHSNEPSLIIQFAKILEDGCKVAVLKRFRDSEDFAFCIMDDFSPICRFVQIKQNLAHINIENGCDFLYDVEAGFSFIRLISTNCGF